MNPRVSVVMTAYKRDALLGRTLASIYRQAGPDLRPDDLEVIVVEDGFDGGNTRAVCDMWPVKYFRRKNRPDVPYSNPAVPNNIGLRRASGDVIILQNAENVHISERAILDLVAPVIENPRVTTFGSVLSLRPNGDPQGWYVHPTENPRPLFFAQAIQREVVEWMRGFDEDFLFYGYDDDDFARRLSWMGIRYKFTDVLFHHQWHAHGSGVDMVTNLELFNRKSVQMSAGKIGPERNLGREWGDINS